MIEHRTYRDGQHPYVREEYTNEAGQFHREDGPALVGEGLEAWFLNGKPHREDGPAVVMQDYRAWFHNGICQRVEFPSGRVYVRPVVSEN